MTEEETEDRLGKINSVHEHHVFVTPEVRNSNEFIYVSKSAFSNSDLDDLKVGGWVKLSGIHATEKGLRARAAVKHDPSENELMRRQLIRYSKTHSMAKGVNPRSQRSDGFDGEEAKKMMRRGAMSLDDYYGHMSENGLQSVAKSYGTPFVPGSREANIRAILEAVAAGL